MSDINFTFGNLFDILYGEGAFLLALLLLLLGAWIRRRWIFPIAGILAGSVVANLIHSLKEAKQDQLFMTGLLISLLSMEFASCVWAFFRLRKPAPTIS